MRLKTILAGVVVVLGLFFATSSLVQGQSCGGCQVYEDCRIIDNSGIPICTWIDGCNGCTPQSCPSGQYRAPDGTCHDIDPGGQPPVGNGGCWEGNVETIWGCDYD